MAVSHRLRLALQEYLHAVLRSYSLLFFSQHLGFAVLLLLATLLHPGAGAAGLAAAGLAVALARAGNFDQAMTRLGAYSFNALLVGLTLGTFYQPTTLSFWLVLAVSAGAALLLAVTLGSWLGQRGLPMLSLPFVLTIWLVVPAAGQLHRLVPNESSIYWLNDAYALGGAPLADLCRRLSDWQATGWWPPTLAFYLRALSAVLFQDSVWTGLLVALGLLWHSRIALCLTVLAYVGASGFLLLAGTAPELLTHYDLGANYMMAALAVGGVFLVPGWRSYLVALLTVPLTAVLVLGLGRLLGRVELPLLSLPFCGTALLALYCLLLRTRPGHLPLTPIQRYSPETNLYAYRNDQIRLHHQLYQPLRLPFRGQWRVTQGYHGTPTHQGEWAQALDFMITDADNHTYHGPGTSLADYYCYDKPVLAPADGTVEAVVMHIPDNPPGTVNTRQNWGNTVVLRHANGLFTQLSHLRPGSAQVAVGDFVRAGEVLAACGNSGRSAEPHLHFQVQLAPRVGAPTLTYPLGNFLTQDTCGPHLRTCAVPELDALVSHPEPNVLLQQAFRLAPGFRMLVHNADEQAAPAQQWESFTDAYNKTYLRCHTTGAVLYFEQHETVFYCTAYYGPTHAWLYAFYQAAYRVPLTYLPHQVVRDTFPLSTVTRPALRWLQDVLAPFFVFIDPQFELRYDAPDNPYHPRAMRLRSCMAMRVGNGQPRPEQEAELDLRDGTLAGLTVRAGATTLRLLCTPAEC